MIVYADGREVVRANGYLFPNGVWSMDDKGVVTLFAGDGDTMKRYRISASEDTNLNTLVADVATAQAKADFDAAQAAKVKARQDAMDAKKKAREDALKAKQKAR